MKAEPKPVPGEFFVRPTRANAEREWPDFYALLDALRGPETLPLRKIAEIAGDTSLNPEPNILRKIKARTLADEARRFILRHIFDDAQLLSGVGRKRLSGVADALYFAALNYFGVREAVQDEARARLVGTYKFWRYSIDQHDGFVMGKLTCFEDPETRAMRVDVRVRKERDESVGSIDQRFSGYLLSLHEMYLTITRRPHSEEVRFTFLPSYQMDLVGTDVNPRSVFAGKQDHIVHMDGLAIGINRRNCFLSPIHLSLVDDVDELAGLDENLGLFTEGDPRLPQRIVNKIKSYGPLRWL